MKVRGLGVMLALGSMAAAVLCAEPAPEASPKPDSSRLLALAIRYEDVSGSELFGSELDWVHRGRRRLVSLGISSSRIDETRWAYVKAGAAGKLGEKTLVSAGVELGEGETAGSSFGYRKTKARITYSPVPSRLQLHAEAQNYAVDRFHGTLVNVGASYRLKPAIAVGVGYAEQVAGNSESRLVTGRIDLERRLGYFAGVAFGTQAPNLAQVALDIRPDADYLEIYAGLSVPVRSQRILVCLNLAEQGETRRRALIAAWRLMLPGSKRGATG